MNTRSRLALLAAACLATPAALAQPTGQTSIQLDTLATSVAGKLKTNGFSGVAVDNATVGGTALSTVAGQAAAALPATALPSTPITLPTTTTPQTLAQLLSPPLTVAQFGPAGDTCTGDSHDMTAAFQAMFNAAALSGQPMTYTGKCYLAETITLGTAPGGLISLSPVGEGEIDTNGQDLIKAVPPAGVAGSIVYKFDLERNEVHSLSATPNTGRLLYVDCTTYGNFCTKNRSTIAGNHLYNMAGALYGSELSSFDVERNVSEHAVTTGAENFIEVHGDSGNCSAGVYTEDNTVTGGSFEYLNGCVQGFTNRFNNLLLGFFGVFSNAPVGVEGINNLGNYFEAGAEGIYLPSVDGTQNIGNSFDPNPASNGGMNANWHAIVAGDPNGGAPAQAAVVSDNYVFNFSGQTVNTPFVVNAGSGSAMHHNTVTGLLSAPHCMLAGTATGTGYAAPVLTMDHNACWAAGDMEAIGTAPQASQNQYTLSANYSLPILYENGPIQPSSVTASGNISGLNDYASGAMFSPQYLPGTAGTALTLGDSGGVNMTGNLTTQVNLYAGGAVFAPQFLPRTGNTQITLGGAGGALMTGPLETTSVGTSGSALTLVGTFISSASSVLAPDFRLIGATIPTSSTSPCNPGDMVDGPLNGSFYHFFCEASGQWGRVALTSAGW